jgi:hypothetical protein
MTRINAGIKPQELCDRHLMAEHREMKRIPNCIKKGRANLDNIPPNFRLGTGHVSFFYNKLGYLKDRYLSVRDECYNRGFNVQDYSDCWLDIPEKLMQDWIPTNEDRRLVQCRIAERLNALRK